MFELSLQMSHLSLPTLALSADPSDLVDGPDVPRDQLPLAAREAAGLAQIVRVDRRHTGRTFPDKSFRLVLRCEVPL